MGETARLSEILDEAAGRGVTQLRGVFTRRGGRAYCAAGYVARRLGVSHRSLHCGTWPHDRMQRIIDERWPGKVPCPASLRDDHGGVRLVCSGTDGIAAILTHLNDDHGMTFAEIAAAIRRLEGSPRCRW